MLWQSINPDTPDHYLIAERNSLLQLRRPRSSSVSSNILWIYEMNKSLKQVTSVASGTYENMFFCDFGVNLESCKKFSQYD